MDRQIKQPLRRRDDRVILQFDYDCFYAQVMENRDPSLKSKPLGIQQKNILATCNYNARKLGVKKLMLISEAVKICPALKIVKGEDLTPFRDTSKILFNFLRSQSWSNKAERLGFDEVFMDVTDVIEYNLRCLNKGSLGTSFFQLSKTNPELGFECDLTSIAGCVEGSEPQSMEDKLENLTYLRLLLGSHFAQYLRRKLEDDFGYTSTCGIATNKALSKLTGSQNKPRNQTTLMAQNDENISNFLSRHTLRQIPGVGAKMVSLIESHILGNAASSGEDLEVFHSKVTVQEALGHSDITPGFLERLLGGAGAEKGVGRRVWGLLQGVDHAPVKEANDQPTQIGIEDTYKGLETIPEITKELYKLSCSLIRRLRVDLLTVNEEAGDGSNRWIAKPKTITLAIRPWPDDKSQPRKDWFWHRISRSGPLPSFVFNQEENIETLAERLLSETLLPLLRRLEPEKGPKWNLQLMNIHVNHMEVGASNERRGAGRDISVMFKRQDEVLQPWKVTDVSDDQLSDDMDGEFESDNHPWEQSGGSICTQCGKTLPLFAMAAHSRYHEMQERD